MTLFLKKKNINLLLKRFTYLFLLTYPLNAPNDLYMTKKSMLRCRLDSAETCVWRLRFFSFFFYFFFISCVLQKGGDK